MWIWLLTSQGIFLASMIWAASELTQEAYLLKEVVNYFGTHYIYLIKRNGTEYLDTMRRVIDPHVFFSCITDKWLTRELWPQKTLLVAWAHLPQEIFFLKQLLSSQEAQNRRILIVSRTFSMVDELVKILKVPFSCELLIVYPNDNLRNKIIEIYSLEEETLIKEWGEWRQEKKTLITPKMEIFTRRQNFMGHKIRIVNSELTLSSPDQHYHNRLISALQYVMNFTVENIWSVEPDIVSEKGTEIGGVPFLKNGIADIASFPFAVTPDRLQELLFVWPTRVVKVYMFAVVDEKRDSQVYLRPYDKFLWLAIVGWIFVAGCSLMIINITKNNKKLYEAVIDGYMYAYSAFCGQGGPISSELPVFLACIMPHINAVVLLSAYSGAVLSFLTVPKYSEPFHDLNGFIENGNYKLTIVQPTYMDAYFAKNEGEQPKRIRKLKLLMPHEKQPKSIESGYQAMCQDHSRIFVESAPSTQNLPCTIRRLDELAKLHMGLVVSDHLEYKELLNRKIRHMHATGLEKFDQRMASTPNPEIYFTPLDHVKVLPLFSVYGCIAILAIFMCTFEVIYNLKMSANKKTQV